MGIERAICENQTSHFYVKTVLLYGQKPGEQRRGYKVEYRVLLIIAVSEEFLAFAGRIR